MADPIGIRHHSMQRLRRLSRRRSARSDEGAFVIDGPLLLAEALDAGVQVDEVVAAPACPTELLARAAGAGADVHETRADDLARVVDTVTPQPVAAIARFAVATPAQAAAAAGPLSLVLVGVADPGNAGTLLRSAEAAGAGAVLFCDDAVDPFSPKCVRSSAGSVFRLAVVRDASADAVLAALGHRRSAHGRDRGPRRQALRRGRPRRPRSHPPGQRGPRPAGPPGRSRRHRRDHPDGGPRRVAQRGDGGHHRCASRRHAGDGPEPPAWARPPPPRPPRPRRRPMDSRIDRRLPNRTRL